MKFNAAQLCQLLALMFCAKLLEAMRMVTTAHFDATFNSTKAAAGTHAWGLKGRSSMPYYNLKHNMPVVVPRQVRAGSPPAEVSLKWASGAVTGLKQGVNQAVDYIVPCPFVEQTKATCDIDETYQAGGQALQFEGIHEDPGAAPLPTDQITKFHQLSSYCRSNQELKGASVDYASMRAFVHTLNPAKKYDDIELLKFARSVAFISEIQLRLPEVMQAQGQQLGESFIPSFQGSPLPEQFWRRRWLKSSVSGQDIAYGADYNCDPDRAIDESEILKDLGCQRMIFFRPPNYFRALVIACETLDGVIQPLAESKGAGLPRYAAHTKNQATMAYGWESAKFEIGWGSRRDIHFAFERAIERWRLSDHGSGKIDLDEAQWEYALSKYVELTLRSEVFRQVRSVSCKFMLNYLQDIYGGDGYSFRLQHHIYNNPLPAHLHGLEGCESEVGVLQHMAVLDTEWLSHQGDGEGQLTKQGILIRGFSQRSFDSFYTNPDIFGHPGVNHMTAGIHTAFVGTAGLMMQDYIDITKNKQMATEGPKAFFMSLMRWLHKSKGRYYYMNVQADRSRRLLFDYGHAGIKLQEGIVHKNPDTTRALLSFLAGERNRATQELSLSASHDDVVKRLLDSWYHVVVVQPSQNGVLWMYNQILYWDPSLALILDKYVTHAPLGQRTPLRQFFLRVLGMNPEASPCAVISELMKPLLSRSAELTRGTWPRELFDSNLMDKDWPETFLTSLQQMATKGTQVVQTVCTCIYTGKELEAPAVCKGRSPLTMYPYQPKHYDPKFGGTV